MTRTRLRTERSKDVQGELVLGDVVGRDGCVRGLLFDHGSGGVGREEEEGDRDRDGSLRGRTGRGVVMIVVRWLV